MSYALTPDPHFVVRDDGVTLPTHDEGNDDCRAYLAWIAAGNAPAPLPAVPPPVPDTISDRQCFQRLAILGKVTPDEALAAVMVGTLPQLVLTGIAALPADEQFGAKMLLCGATSFERLHPMTPVFLAFFGLNGTSDRDALWTAAAAL